jgi:hypothetical protein
MVNSGFVLSLVISKVITGNTLHGTILVPFVLFRYTIYILYTNCVVLSSFCQFAFICVVPYLLFSHIVAVIL